MGSPPGLGSALPSGARFFFLVVVVAVFHGAVVDFMSLGPWGARAHSESHL